MPELSPHEFGIEASSALLASESPFIMGTSPFFSRVDNDRPYEPTGMSTDRWRELEPEEVPLDVLVGGQHELSANRVRNAAQDIYAAEHGGDTHPHVVFHDGEYHLSDGHHRVAAAKSLGLGSIRARVLRPGGA